MFPDRRAPRAARYCVGTIERPAPELRDSVVLLTSELVSRSVRLHRSTSHELLELRVWMGSDGARVEVRGTHELVCANPQPDGHEDDVHEDDLLLFDALADRWSIDTDERGASIWFEIDRKHHRRDPGSGDTQLGPDDLPVRRVLNPPLSRERLDHRKTVRRTHKQPSFAIGRSGHRAAIPHSNPKQRVI